jgi:ribonuclease BN (tRNA processing enzyme)
MQVTIVPSAALPQGPQPFSSLVVNGVLAIDAGCLHSAGTIDDLRRIKHIFITHSHLDHVASLPPFLDAVHGNAHVLDCLRKDVFNNRLYPDFLHISTIRPPYLKLNELVSGQMVEAAGLRVTAVEVNHVVPTLGYLIEDDETAVLFPGDTGPTEEIWKVAARRPQLKAVFLECTFPRSMTWLADLARHLTPELYAVEMEKLGRAVRFITIHMHPRHRPVVTEELLGMNLPGVEIGEMGVAYTF